MQLDVLKESGGTPISLFAHIINIKSIMNQSSCDTPQPPTGNRIITVHRILL